MEPTGVERHRRQPARASFRAKANQSKHTSRNYPKSLSHTGYTKRPRRESNPHLRFRKPPFYPLNYGDASGSKKLEGRNGKSRDQIFDFALTDFLRGLAAEVTAQYFLFKQRSPGLTPQD